MVGAVPASLLPGLGQVVVGSAGALRLGGGPLERGADLLGLDLDGGATLALVGLPGALAQGAVDEHPVALGQAVGQVLGHVLGNMSFLRTYKGVPHQAIPVLR
jgi:hypothetical protein